MDDRFTDGDLLTMLKRLVIEMGTPQLLRLIADIAEEHANDLLRQGASLQAARCAREARILSRAAETMSS